MEFSINHPNPGKKMTGIVFVALLHVALILALANGLGKTILPITPKPFTVTVVQENERDPVEPPQVKQIPLKPIDPAFVPPPEVPVVQVASDPPRVITAQRPDGDLVIARIDPDAHAEPVRVPPALDAQACDKPDYPSRELRDGVEGTTVLQFLIGANGKVMNSKVARSSGSRALDNAALAGLTRCPFKAAMVDGKPEPAWTKIQYVWKIE